MHRRSGNHNQIASTPINVHEISPKGIRKLLGLAYLARIAAERANDARAQADIARNMTTNDKSDRHTEHLIHKHESTSRRYEWLAKLALGQEMPRNAASDASDGGFKGIYDKAREFLKDRPAKPDTTSQKDSSKKQPNDDQYIMGDFARLNKEAQAKLDASLTGQAQERLAAQRAMLSRERGNRDADAQRMEVIASYLRELTHASSETNKTISELAQALDKTAGASQHSEPKHEDVDEPVERSHQIPLALTAPAQITEEPPKRGAITTPLSYNDQDHLSEEPIEGEFREE